MAPEVEKTALVTAAAVVASVLGAMALHLADPWWAGLSALIVSTPDHRALVLKAGLRIVGSLAGALLGYWLALQLEGNMLLQLYAMAALGAVGTWGRFRSRFGYAWLMFSISALLMIYVTLMEPAELRTFAIARVQEILLGVSVASLFALMAAGRHGTAHLFALPPQPERPVFLLPFMGAITAVAVPAVWSYFALPSLPQIAISVLVCLDRDDTISQTKGAQRIAGCLLGGAAGLVCVGFGTDTLIGWALLLFLGTFFFARLHNSGLAHAYVGTQGGIAFLLTLVTGLGPPETIEPILNRFAGITAGICLLVAINALFVALKPLSPVVRGDPR